MKNINEKESLKIVEERIENNVIFGLALVMSSSPEEIAFMHIEQYRSWLDKRSNYIYGCELWLLSELIEKGFLLEHYNFSKEKAICSIDNYLEHIKHNYLNDEDKWITVLFTCYCEMRVECKNYDSEGLEELRTKFVEYSKLNSDIFIFSGELIDSNEQFFLHVRLK